MASRLYQRIDMGQLEPGEFRVEADGWRTVACPRCGATDVLRPARAGFVTQRWPCPDESCPYVDYLFLEEIV